MLYTKICNYCKQKGINIYKLEKELGLGNATIRGWRSSSPRIENLKRVADYFGITVDELMSEEL